MLTEREKIIREAVPVVELLAGLAEESAELIQAALKLRRVFDRTNPTPVTEDQAMESLYEEIADVMLYLSMIDLNWEYIDVIKTRKEIRWTTRLTEAKKAEK